jgi:hypothetical protein
MLNGTFLIDWVFIDSVIIILLFLLLFSVRIFKNTHRWRSTYSNEALKRLACPQMLDSVKNQSFTIKRCFLTRNSSIEKENSKPVILILRSYYKRKLLTILTEGLSSYGFNVITLRIKMNKSSLKAKSDDIITDLLNTSISTIILNFLKKKLIINPEYLLLTHSKFKFSYNSLLLAENNIGILSINPKVTERNIKSFFDSNHNFHHNHHLFTIFSRKSVFSFKNKNLKRFKKAFTNSKSDTEQLNILDRAKNSFKYHETLILGIIIDILKNKLMNPNT